MQEVIEQLAEELFIAEKRSQTVLPITERFTELSDVDSYHVQLAYVKRKVAEDRTVIGKKVGLTSKAMQQMLGVDEPDYGHLFDDMKLADGNTIPLNTLIAPKVEAEIGFILGEDLVGPHITYVDVLNATKFIVPTLEIIDSRIADWNIQLVDTIADNGSSARVVLGNKLSTINEIDLRSASMVLYKNNEMVATGAGAAALGHPAQAIAWLANKLSEFNIPLKAGELILPGALSAAVVVNSGDAFKADFGKLGTVSIRFE